MKSELYRINIFLSGEQLAELETTFELKVDWDRPNKKNQYLIYNDPDLGFNIGIAELCPKKSKAKKKGPKK